MNPIFQYIIVESVKCQLKKKDKKPSSKQFEREIQNTKVGFVYIVSVHKVVIFPKKRKNFSCKNWVLKKKSNIYLFFT